MEKLIPITLFAATVIVRLIAYLATRYTVDDALITFRYAENLATGNGFVYNIGERVLGTSTPLFTLLLAGGNWLGIGSLTAAMIVNLSAAGLTAIVLYSWAQQLDMGKLALLPAIIYIVFPRSIICDICGMETALFTLLVTTTFYWLHRRQSLAAVTAASLATVARPEGWALLALVIVLILVYDRRQLLFSAIPILLIAGNWLLFAFLYFGSIIPNSITAKMALYSGYERFSGWQNASIALGLSSPFGWVIWPLFVLGGLQEFRKANLLGVIALWVTAYLGALIASGTHVFFWYPAPVYPVVFLVVTIAIIRLSSSRLLPASFMASNRWLVVAALFVAIPSIAHLVSRVDDLRAEMADYEQVHVAAANLLSQQARPGDKVLAEDIGYFGYYFSGRIIDRDGLVTPQAAIYNRARQYRRFADSVAAEWLFIDPDYPTAQEIVTATDFAARYKPVALPGVADRPCHQLYRRIIRQDKDSEATK